MNENFYLKIKLEKDGIKPTRAIDGDAGLDFYCPKDYDIQPWGSVLIPLELRTQFPKGYALIFKEKSGIATKKNLHIGACVVDSLFRGIVHAHFFNASNNKIELKRGDKIIQGIIIQVWIGDPIIVDNIDMNTERCENGFGSTDLKGL
jgi:deoxyuridine 5'-triphosphate nucleotidohydrolase